MQQSKNPTVSNLFKQRDVVHDVIESIVKYQHGKTLLFLCWTSLVTVAFPGSLNNAVETMTGVVGEYSR
jgi:hypothetical protein